MGIHGGLNETSVFMHLRPDLVDLSRAERKVPEALADNEHVKFGGSVAFGWLSNDFDDAGYIGDPTGATLSVVPSCSITRLNALGSRWRKSGNSTLVDDDRYSVVVGSLTLSLQ